MDSPNTANTFIRPVHEILDLLDTTRPDSGVIRVRVKPDRRVRQDPPPGGEERRLPR